MVKGFVMCQQNMLSPKFVEEPDNEAGIQNTNRVNIYFQRGSHKVSMLTLHFCNGCCLSLFSQFCQRIIRTSHKKIDKNGYRGVTLYLVASKWEITESLVLRAGYLVELFLQPISPLGRLVLAF